MDNNFAKLSHFRTYKNAPTAHSESNLKGQIYELFCYNRLINTENYIVKANCFSKEEHGNFSYNKLGKINFHSDNIHLAEFDILGIQNMNIYFFEITRSEQGKKLLKNEIERKIELLNKLFPQYTINFTLILPKIIIGYEKYNIKIIEEPNYTKYINKEYFEIDKKIEKCISLKEFSEHAIEYSYINDIINLSKKYFSSNNKDILLKQHLIERIYDINNITNENFFYYSIENKKYGNISIKNNKIFRDGKIINERKKCNYEIKLIREIYNENKYCT